jgi:hypothetical protein
MEGATSFTYLRLGDGELALLLSWQEGEVPQAIRDSGSSEPIFHAQSVNGLKTKDYSRLLHAYEECSYLDTFERVPYSAANYHRLRLNRNPQGVNSPSSDVSQIFYEWGYYELPAYVARHRCIFCSSEALLLRELLVDDRYQRATRHFWKFPVDLNCVGIPDYGRHYWCKLEDIKSYLVESIRSYGANTLFLALASGAKILCQEIAFELGVRCFDLGAISLALTYSATPGHSVARNSHNPFYFRVPLDAYLDCLTRAYPDLPTAGLVAKAQGQLCFDLLRKEPMNSFVPEINQPENFQFSPENVKYFNESLDVYKARFGEFLRGTKEGRRLASEFARWRMSRGWGPMGKIVMAKRYLSSVISRIGHHLDCS